MLIVLFITTLVGCDSDDDWEEIAFRVGDYQSILERSDDNSLYKGMIYEYGIGVKVDIGVARNIYINNDNRSESKRREFLLCFIYCEDELNVIYENISADFNDVDFLYSVYLLSQGIECSEHVLGIMCSLASDTFNIMKVDDPYYLLGYEIYIKIINQAKSFKDFEMPYYLIKKSEVQGNSKAKSFLDGLPDGKSWVPRLQ